MAAILAPYRSGASDTQGELYRNTVFFAVSASSDISYIVVHNVHECLTAAVHTMVYSTGSSLNSNIRTYTENLLLLLQSEQRYILHA
jgi:hypothetical protein